MYNITPYTYKKAKDLGVRVFPSDNPRYKIEIYGKDGLFMFYVGGKGYKDFPTYIDEKGIEYANKRRELYKKRHQKDRARVGSRGWYADQLLW
jgi:hypothetical protein